VIPLAQSAIVFSTDELSVERVVAHAGYVHSGGPLVLAAPWQDVEPDDLIDKGREYLDRCELSSADLIWYTRGYAEDHPSDEPRELHPLPGLEIDEKRYHLGERPFREESNRVKDELRKARKGKGTGALLYAYRDVAIHASATLPPYLHYPDRSSQDWLVVYETHAKKENPIHDLDDAQETKLFWAGIFTTPHRLVNAMLNLCEVEEGDVVLDPFAHTGTVAIEAAQFGARTQSFDLSEVLGAQDNFEFFCAENPGDDLSLVEKLFSNIELFSQLSKLADERSGTNVLGLPDIAESDRIESLLRNESTKDVLGDRGNRILYWLLRRSALEAKRAGEAATESAAKTKAVQIVTELRQHLVRLEGLRAEPFVRDDGRLCVVPGTEVTSEFFPTDWRNRSPRVFLSYSVDPNNHGFEFEEADITDGLLDIAAESIDIVATDPPYGYGDDIPYDLLRKIWLSFFRMSLRVLRDGGALVFCALDKVKTGRPLNTLLKTEELLDLLNCAAAEQNIHFGFPSIDPVATHARGLYYWKSPRSLNRSLFAARIYRAKPEQATSTGDET